MTDDQSLLDFAAVESAEGQWLDQRGQGRSGIGIAFSGGGIRSATFCSGVAEALDEQGILRRADYLSTVSGGGYAGSGISYLLHKGDEHLFTTPLASGKGRVLDWICLHASYLTSGFGFSNWTLAAGILTGTLLNLVVLLAPLLFLVTAMTVELLPLEWPPEMVLSQTARDLEHDGFTVALFASVIAGVFLLVGVLLFAGLSHFAADRLAAARQSSRIWLGKLLMATLALAGIATIPFVAGLEDQLSSNPAGDASWFTHAHYLLPLGLAVVAKLRGHLGLLIPLTVLGLVTLGYQVAIHLRPFEHGWFWIWLGVSLVLALLSDVNWISMFSYYRARLTETWLPQTRADEPTAISFRLDDVAPRSGLPLHLINSSVNALSSSNPRLAQRGNDNFVFSPVCYGAHSTGYRAANSWTGPDATLCTAFTVSGAAIDPDTPQTKARGTSFLMALLNVRLGYWMRHPRNPSGAPALMGWYRFLFREMFGYGLSPDNDWLHLSDGGHFDNTAIYELIRRRCSHIIAVDAGLDPTDGLASLGQLAERVATDFSARIDLSVATPADGALAPTRLEGEIHYADGSKGRLTVVKSGLTEDLPVDVYAWSRAHPHFPFTSTADQFYDEPEFEAYRHLGRTLGQDIALRN